MSFRFQGKRVFLTYASHLDKQAFSAWINEKQKTVELYIAHETGSTTYEHSHVLVWFGKKVDTTNARFFDYEEIHPNIQRVPFTRDWNNLLRYIAKQDQSIKAPKPTLAEKVWIHENVQDLLMDVEKPVDVGGLMAIWNMKPAKRLKVDNPLIHHWQEQVKELLSQEADFRSVMWIVDHIGATGKSHMQRYLRIHHPNEVLVVQSAQSLYHFATIFANSVQNMDNLKMVWFNLPRTALERKGIYECIEAVKDTCITTTKYQGLSLPVFDPVHVIVTANFAPDVSKLSSDRWQIRHIQNGRLITLSWCPFCIEQAEKAAAAQAQPPATSTKPYPDGLVLEVDLN